MAPDTAAGEWPDELGDVIAEFSAKHPWVWRRTLIRSWIDQRIGRWLPALCRHRSAVGPVDGPLTCMDCGRPTDV